MPKKLKITLDANIIISAMFWSGFPRVILRKCVKGEVELVLSREILNEVKEVFRKEKKFGMSEEKILERERLLIDNAKLVTPGKRLSVVKEDAKDNKILECGEAGKVDFIVTGDNHLLKLKKYGKIKIITARKIVELLEKPTL